MAFHYSPKLVTDGLVLALDAANPKSYPGTGTTWYDLSGNGDNFTLDGSGITHNSEGYFTLADGGASKNGTITTATSCTLVFWLKTTDTQALFWATNGGSGSYLGAYRSGNKFYNSSTYGTPTFHTNTVQRTNIYDFIRTDTWMMMEFKNVNMSAAGNHHFNQYGSYTFGNGSLGSIYMYDRTLTSSESEQNYNELKTRFGL
jgi:hypothetical protein